MEESEPNDAYDHKAREPNASRPNEIRGMAPQV
jgi:hypothetical protein